MKAKRLLSLILASLMVSASLAGCADTTAEETEAAQDPAAVENVAEETEKPYLDNLPEQMDFGGAEIRFLSATETVSIELTEGDDTGDVVNDAYWKRNEALNGRTNAKIILANQVGYNEFNSTATQSITAGSDDYDIFCGHTRFNINLAASNYMMNLNKNGFTDYIDITQPYWSELYISNVNYKDNLYWLAGDMTHSFISTIYATFANATVWNNHYSGESLYDIVLEGNWTLDTLNHYAEGTYIDNNGDGAYDDGDSYGIIMQQGHVLNGMTFAAGIEFTAIDADGNYSVALNNEHTVNAYTALHNLFYSTAYGRMLHNDQFDGLAVSMFTEDRLLFCPNTFGFASNENIRNMESDFYIIPLPKYDAEQEAYRVNQYDGVPIYGVPTTLAVDKIPMIASIMEVMCSMTSDMVIPAYYDVALKNKYSRDQTTAQMIDLIRDSVTADFCFYWGDSVGGLMGFFYTNIEKPEIASALKRSEKPWTKALQLLLEKLEDAE